MKGPFMNPSPRPRWPWLTLLVVVGFLVPMPVLAEQVHRDVLDGDFEDAAIGGPRGKTWLTLGAFTRAYELGQRDVGAMAVVGVALDRIAARDGDRAGVEVQAGDVAGHAAPPRLPLSRELARLAVNAAWRSSGLGADDARLESIVSRARWSALLPETRLRATRLLDDRTDTADPTSLATRQNLGLEARLTWRFDRLLYADEETSVERVRIDRGEARVRIATRVLSALASWQRAWVEGRRAAADSTDALDCALRTTEAEATLDVLTGGWFSSWRARSMIE
jgi:hypothetical protein